MISSLYKEKFSPDPNLIVSDSYTFPRALYATGLHLGSLWLWSLFRLALETWYLAWEHVLIDIKEGFIRTNSRENNRAFGENK